jgi:hypothetical protein
MEDDGSLQALHNTLIRKVEASGASNNQHGTQKALEA